MKVGKQADDTWVLSGKVHLSSAGNLVALEDSRYIWIGHVFTGKGVASNTDQCTIELPLMTDPLCALMEALKIHFGHNFVPCVMTMASAVLALHYELI